MEGPARALAADGIEIKFSSELEPADLDRFNAFIVNRPHQTEELYLAVQHLLEAKKRIIIDFDLDFLHIPKYHQEYQTAGPGNPPAMERYREILSTAQIITVPTQQLADRLQSDSNQVVTIPSGWNRDSMLWNAPKPKRQTVNFGILSTHVQSPIESDIQSQIAEGITELPEGLLVVAGDYQLMSQFKQLPENKKLFLPLGSFQDYPYTLTHFDVLLAPERLTEFTKSKPDLSLLEAGLQKIPWLASRIPSYMDWETGGHFVQPKDWRAMIKRLGNNPEERETLGLNGFQKAKQRECSLISKRWLELID
jgi:glycosyltransferase involved in cell wall biosynthesis